MPRVTADGGDRRIGRLWVDISGLLLWSGRPSGIPRVTAEIASRLVRMDSISVRLCRFEPATGTYEELSAEHPRVASALGFLRSQPLFERMHAALSRTGQSIARGEVAVLRWIPPAGRGALGGLWTLGLESARSSTKAVLRITSRVRTRLSSRTIEFCERDVLLDLGGSWGIPGFGPALSRLKAQRPFRYAVVINDMIPWRLPQMLSQGFAPMFLDWARHALDAADLVLAISESTRRDVADYVAEHLATERAIEVIRLGDDFSGNRADATAAPLLDPPFVLCVGTIEIRKNHTMLYHVWRRLVAEHGDAVPPLVLAGRPGWLVDDLLYQIEHDPLTRGRILLLGGVSDSELEWLYQNCLFTVYPSHYEGWGLPVIESLARGKYCVASSSSSLPEAGGPWCDYHDPLDFATCYRLIARGIFDSEYRESRKEAIRHGYRAVSWDVCAAAVLDLLLKHFAGTADGAERTELAGTTRP